MSLVGRALRRPAHQAIGPSLLSDAERNAANPHPAAAEPEVGKQGVLLEDLVRARPSSIRPDLQWASQEADNTQATSDDDIDLFGNPSELEVGQWQAAESSTAPEQPPDQASQAAEAAPLPPEPTDPGPEKTIAPERLPSWIRGRSRLRVLATIVSVALAITGGIMFFAHFFATPASPGLAVRPRTEVPPPQPPAPSGLDSPTPSAAAKATPEAAPVIPAREVGSKRAVATSTPAPARHVTKKAVRPVRAKPHAKGSAPRPNPKPAPEVPAAADSGQPGHAKPTKSGLAFYNEGARLQKKGATDAAMSAYAMALGRDPSLIEAHNNLGVLRMHSGDASGAEQSLRAAIGLNSRYGPAYANLGRLYIQQRRTDQAELMLLRAATLMPSNSSVRNNLALLYQLLGRDEDEAKAWRAALALGSADPAVHYNLAVHYQRLGENALARTHYEKALATEHRLSPAYRDAVRQALESLKGE